jgi:hypothetical protein
MIATHPSTLRAAVITLLRKSGESPISAVDLWDRVYSRQILQAAPGAHRLLIGAYTLEFTKPETAPIEEGQPIESVTGDRFPLGFLALVIVLAIIGIPLLIRFIF